jgi:hypothetical protein
MALQIRRGPTTDRTGKTFAEGELVFDTTEKALYVGDGSTVGGKAASSYTDERAVDAVGAALVAGTGNVVFTYGTTQDNANRIDATVTLDGIGLTAISQDTDPMLGGSLDLNEHDITGTGNINIDGDVTAMTFYGELDGNAATVTNGIYAGQKFHIGTTEIDIARTSASQTLTGTSIDGNAGTATKLETARAIQGVNFDGSAAITVVTQGTGVTVSGTQVSIGQAVATTSNVTFNDVIVSGDLTVNGTTTTLNTTTLDVEDINITVAKNATSSGAADGAGITIGNYVGNGTLQYTSTGDKFVFNKRVDSTSFNGPLTGSVTGNVTGNISGIVTGALGSTLIGELTGNVYASNGTNLVLDSGTNGADAEFTGTVNATGSNRILVGDGTNLVPSIAFNSDGSKDTGFYWGGDGYVNVASNGVQTAQFAPGGEFTLGASGTGILNTDTIYTNNIRVSTGNTNGGYIKFWDVVNFSNDIDFAGNVSYQNHQAVFVQGFKVVTGPNPADVKADVTTTLAKFNVPVRFGSYTLIERNALSASNGDVVYCTNSGPGGIGQFCGYANGSWFAFGAAV